MTPRASLVLPTYNHFRFLKGAVTTALEQTFTDFELIVIDDGSTDGTADWLSTLDDPRLVVRSRENRGFIATVNEGLGMARAPYVTWISADNLMAPYFVEAFVSALDSAPGCRLAYSPYWNIDAEGRIAGVKHDNVLMSRDLVTLRPRGNCAFMYHRSLHDELGPYRGGACDTLFWSLAIERTRPVMVQEPTYFYRLHDDRVTVRDPGWVWRDAPEIPVSFAQRHGGFDSAASLVALYPGLAQAPAFLPDALADLAARLAATGFRDEPLAMLMGAAASSSAAGLHRIVHNIVALAGAQDDPVAIVDTALSGNQVLSPEEKQAASALVRSLRVLHAASPARPIGIELDGPLAKAEKPVVFSYAAWKAGCVRSPVQAV
jgi:hypothetical protein